MITPLLEEIESPTPKDCLVIWGLGGASIAIRTPECVAYLDLYCGASPRADLVKLTPDLINPSDVHRADVVLCTHVHVDHCHLPTLRALHGCTSAVFVVAQSCARRLQEDGFSSHRILSVEPGDEVRIRDLRILAVPSRDWSDPHAVGFILESAGVRVYDAGDSMFTTAFREIGLQGKIDLALLNFAGKPAGRESPFMSYTELARAAVDLKAERCMIKHWDIWEHTYIEPTIAVARLRELGVEVSALAGGDRIVLSAGQRSAAPSG